MFICQFCNNPLKAAIWDGDGWQQCNNHSLNVIYRFNFENKMDLYVINYRSYGYNADINEHPYIILDLEHLTTQIKDDLNNKIYFKSNSIIEGITPENFLEKLKLLVAFQ